MRVAFGSRLCLIPRGPAGRALRTSPPRRHAGSSRHAAGGRPSSAYLLGLAFGFGWTPCIGPILGAILTLSAVSASVSAGIVLLATYSLGLGVPFLLSAVFTARLVARYREVKRVGRLLYVVAGGVMFVTGIAMLTGHLSVFAIWLLQTFPALGSVG